MDPLTIMGIAANAMQILNFSAECVKGVKYCLDTTQDAPRVLKDILIVLPILTKIVALAEQNAAKRLTKDETDDAIKDRNTALLSTTEACSKELGKLNKILEEVLPKEKESHFAKIGKGIKVIMRDGRMEKISDRLSHYTQTILNYQAMQMHGRQADHMGNMEQAAQEMAKAVQIDGVSTQLDGMRQAMDQLKQEMQNHPSNARIDAIMNVLLRIDNNYDKERPMQIPMDMVQAFMAEIQKNFIERAKEEDKKPIENIPPQTSFVPRPALQDQIQSLLSPSRPRSTTSAPTVVLRGMAGQGESHTTGSKG